MTVDVVAVGADDLIAEVASTFAARRINGAPVLRDGTLVGIVTSTDLMRAAESNALRVGDVMASDVVTVTEEMTIPEATRVLARRSLHRAPVMRGGAVVGMLTRTDLLRPYLRTDGEIRAAAEEVIQASMGIGHDAIHVRVLDGVVFVEGSVRGHREHELLKKLVAGISGVAGVIDHVRVTPVSPIEDTAAGHTASS